MDAGGQPNVLGSGISVGMIRPMDLLQLALKAASMAMWFFHVAAFAGLVGAILWVQAERFLKQRSSGERRHA